ncbi:leucine-rich repeat domain-containing protein [Wolbachia endosymbiont of Ctenocephalides felis wCfeT]|uniref:hypothetical protein n=1 Tax=Wolbachia endosymbiont of Ctenocephalides felis wCfeT TaxID=2732593 RepID=UPI001FEC00D5|nr:hypothetical protein [Wolbachia endosymbiont of Ctenocephalides felis wCfeT]
MEAKEVKSFSKPTGYCFLSHTPEWIHEGVKILINFLKKNKNLTKNITSLNLSRNNIGDEGLEALAEYLKESNIILLDLSHNFLIRGKGAKALVEKAVERSNTISLDLRWNQIKGEDVKDIEETLKKNKNITRYNLAIQLEADIAKAMAEYREKEKDSVWRDLRNQFQAQFDAKVHKKAMDSIRKSAEESRAEKRVKIGMYGGAFLAYPLILYSIEVYGFTPVGIIITILCAIAFVASGAIAGYYTPTLIDYVKSIPHFDSELQLNK